MVKRKIPCFCDNTFTVDAPEEIDLDLRPEYLDEIMAGTFMNFTCGNCGKVHKPEFPLRVRWPSHKAIMEVLPEQDRMGFYRKKADNPTKFPPEEETIETVIGYGELAERLAVIRDGLEAMTVEALKYYFLAKAEETNPDSDISIWYQKRGTDSLEFHIHGLKEGEVAVTRVPLEVYEKSRDNYIRHPKSEPFASLRFHTYLSVQNLLCSEGLK
jgi:hypothetical protein